MTAATIEIWSNGTLKPDITVESVTANLERLFPSATPEQRARFLAGKPFRVTTVADAAAADRATSALQAAGIVVVQRPTATAATPPKPQVAATLPTPATQPSRSEQRPPAGKAAGPHTSQSITRPNPPFSSQPTQPVRTNISSPVQPSEAYLPYESSEEPPKKSLLVRFYQFTFGGGANWKQALGVTAVGYFLIGLQGQNAALRILGMALFMWGLFMLIRRRAPLPDGFQEELERIAKEMGDSQLLFATKKEMHQLPAVLSADERLLAFSSGFMSGNTWLITLTDRRIIFLDKGLFYGLKQVAIDLDKVNSVSGSTGVVFGKLFIGDNAGQHEIKNVPRGSVLKFTNKVRDAIEFRKNNLAGGVHRPNDVSSQLSQLASLHEKGLLTSDEFNQQKAKLFTGA